MPLELQVIKASEFVRLDPHENLDFEASKQALQTLAHACKKRGLACALLDLRAVPVPDRRLFTPNELAALVSTFREAGFTRHQRLAILYSHDIYGGIRSFAFISRLRGLKVQPFTDFEKALTWLSDAEEIQAPARTTGNTVQIKARAVSKQQLRPLTATGTGDTRIIRKVSR